ncbi:SMI1/KNR4 family protein [Amycolatopsis sp. lyj-90]|uniref:SMI1/KNR4 family protein n=1 Tax=Amycolatopsis sp. lyj-90 TaxID=2789285 RepID=UPI00397804A5
MDRPELLSPADWHGFLRSYSAEFLDSEFLHELESEGRDKYFVSEVQRSSGWLGYEPATEEEIATTEKRIGTRLPPTYRNFLLASNGWSTISYAVDLRKVDDIGWFADLEPNIMKTWSELEHFADHIELLKQCLLISDDNGGSGQYLLLHASSAGDNADWDAYEWWPGDGEAPEHYENFAAMVTTLHQDYHED